MPLDYSAEPNFVTEWFKVKRRQTNYTFTEAEISPEKFFVFEVRNQRRYGTIITTNPYIAPVQIKVSGIFYFGNQGKITFPQSAADCNDLEE